MKPWDRDIAAGNAESAREENEHERNLAACRVSLPLTPEDRTAFDRRERILTGFAKWPLQNWYTDEDFCRACNTAFALHDQLEEAKAEIETLRGALRSMFEKPDEMSDNEIEAWDNEQEE